MRLRSTPDMISLTTFCRDVAPGLSLSVFNSGSNCSCTSFHTLAFLPSRISDPGAAQSRQRNGALSVGVNGTPSASASSASRNSRSSRMRRNKIQVSSGTYCNAPAQFERRMISQIDFTAALSDCGEPCFLRGRSMSFLFTAAWQINLVASSLTPCKSPPSCSLERCPYRC